MRISGFVRRLLAWTRRDPPAQEASGGFRPVGLAPLALVFVALLRESRPPESSRPPVLAPASGFRLSFQGNWLGQSCRSCKLRNLTKSPQEVSFLALCGKVLRSQQLAELGDLSICSKSEVNIGCNRYPGHPQSKSKDLLPLAATAKEAPPLLLEHPRSTM